MFRDEINPNHLAVLSLDGTALTSGRNNGIGKVFNAFANIIFVLYPMSNMAEFTLPFNCFYLDALEYDCLRCRYEGEHTFYCPKSMNII